MFFKQQWKCVIQCCKLADRLSYREDSFGNVFRSQVSVNGCNSVWKLMCELWDDFIEIISA